MHVSKEGARNVKGKCSWKYTYRFTYAFKINNYTFEEGQKFQIIFCDPPYKEKKIELLIENIIEMNILEKNGIIIIHRKKGDLDVYPKKFKVIDTKNYGLSTFVFGRSN